MLEYACNENNQDGFATLKSARAQEEGRRRQQMRCIGALSLAVLVCLAIQWSSRAQAQQQRTAADGVYTDAQATRGEAISDAKCVACHGVALSGDIAPPLVGQDFLTVWQKPPLADLFDKILNTMPADALGTLTRPETADLVAYLLKANKFPAGNAELPTDEATLRQISLRRTTTAASPAAAAAFTPRQGRRNP